MTISVQNSSSALPPQQPGVDDRFLNLRDTLARDGITITPTTTNIGMDGKLHKLERSGQPGKSLPFTDQTSTFCVLLRARMAMGILPPAAQTFSAALSPASQSELVRLFAEGAVLPEEEEIRYGKRDDNLYRKANNASIENHELVLTFGNDFGNGPGVLKLSNDGGLLKARASFQSFGTRETQLELLR